MKLSPRLLTFPAGASMITNTRRTLATNIFAPLLTITKPPAGAPVAPPPGAVFLLSLPDYCFFIFIEKQ